jgi:hypothetical protein
MDKYLYRNFLSDSVAYDAAESLWSKHWEELRERVGDPNEWETPWLNTRFADGTPCRDGNPIFSAISPLHRRGIRVIQLEPAADPRELYFWIDTFDEGGPNGIDELVISCALTRETLMDAMNMMRQWIDDGQIELSQGGYYPGFPTGSRRRLRRLPNVSLAEPRDRKKNEWDELQTPFRTMTNLLPTLG